MSGPKNVSWMRRKVDTVTPEELDLIDDPVVPGQVTLFGSDDEFKVQWQHWKGMPEFAQEDLRPMFRTVVNFRSEEDLREFERLTGQVISRSSVNSIWFPPLIRSTFKDKQYRSVLDEELS